MRNIGKFRSSERQKTYNVFLRIFYYLSAESRNGNNSIPNPIFNIINTAYATDKLTTGAMANNDKVTKLNIIILPLHLNQVLILSLFLLAKLLISLEIKWYLSLLILCGN